MRVQDQARDLVGVIRHQRFAEEGGERHFSQRHLRYRTLLGIGRCHARQQVARARGCRFRHQVFQISKAVRGGADGVGVGV